jgi:hypothetical protein
LKRLRDEFPDKYVADPQEHGIVTYDGNVITHADMDTIISAAAKGKVSSLSSVVADTLNIMVLKQKVKYYNMQSPILMYFFQLRKIPTVLKFIIHKVKTLIRLWQVSSNRLCHVSKM